LMLLSVSLSLLAALSAFAAPSKPTFGKRQIETLSPGAVAAFKPYSFYAASAYCNPSNLGEWTCGANCDANPGFLPVASGGDGIVVQYWYVGYDPSLDTIIVGHQGTDTKKIIPLLTDLNTIPVNLDSSLFPGISSDVRVHAGFRDAHSLAAEDVLTAVNTAIADFGVNTITTVGHSLGAAISLLDAIYLKLQIPNSAVRFYGYGLPRVGNQEFANLADDQLDSLARITNREDPIPTVPIRLLGFKHPSGEDHIKDDGNWKACPGQDNPSKQCIDGDVPLFLFGDIKDHSGPYDGVIIRC